MSIYDQLMSDLKTALRERDELRKSTIRMALAALKNARVEKNADLTDDEMIAVLNREVRRRRDSMQEYEKGNRPDLAAREAAEIEILQQYLPRPLSEDEIVAMAREVIAEVGASTPRQMGQVMRVLMPRLRGSADGRLVSEIVRRLLSGQM